MSLRCHIYVQTIRSRKVSASSCGGLHIYPNVIHSSYRIGRSTVFAESHVEFFAGNRRELIARTIEKSRIV